MSTGPRCRVRRTPLSLRTRSGLSVPTPVRSLVGLVVDDRLAWSRVRFAASSWALSGQAGPVGGVEQHLGGHLETLDGTEAGVLVLDVDEHVWVDCGQCGEPGRPEHRIVAAAERDELPGSILRPLIGPYIPAQVPSWLVWRQPAEPVVQDAVYRSGCPVHSDILCGGM